MLESVSGFPQHRVRENRVNDPKIFLSRKTQEILPKALEKFPVLWQSIVVCSSFKSPDSILKIKGPVGIYFS